MGTLVAILILILLCNGESPLEIHDALQHHDKALLNQARFAQEKQYLRYQPVNTVRTYHRFVSQYVHAPFSPDVIYC